MSSPHISVLRDEVVGLFAPCRLKSFVDGTVGAGGHAEAILSKHPEIERFIAIDQDSDALAIAKERLSPWREKLLFIQDNFSSAIPKLEREVDGILLDLGVSSMQLDRAERGFSFSKEGPLDMRMDRSGSLTAAEVVNTFPFGELCRIIRQYGEEKQWRRAAKAIVEARERGPIETTKELSDILRGVLISKRGRSIDPSTLVFQALRIFVNGELEVIHRVLPRSIEKLRPKGRLAVITFHSLEDRIVKRAFRFAASDKAETSGLGAVFLDKEPEVADITRRPITAGEEELSLNPRSRSAKLRAVEKL